MIEITCTKHEQQILITTLIAADFCTNGYPKHCTAPTCRSCMRTEIKWNIIDKEEE